MEQTSGTFFSVIYGDANLGNMREVPDRFDLLDHGRKSTRIGNQIGVGLARICTMRPDSIAIIGV
jgi:hypothetical protein